MMQKWTYWISTVLLALLYLAGSPMYLSDIAGVQPAFVKFGYPGYLVPILAVVKLLGAVVILWRPNAALRSWVSTPVR